MTIHTSTRPADDGVRLFTRHAMPRGAPRAAFVVVHGIAEHGGRWEAVATSLAEAGFEVRVSDLRGFGRSGGPPAYVDRFDRYLDDLVEDVVAARGSGVPVVLYGHSMGGLIALAYSLSDRPRPDLLVLSAPALEARVPLFKKLTARILGRLVPRLGIPNELEGSQLSRDEAVGEAYFADELVRTKTTTRLGAEFLGAMRDTREALHALDVPTLVLQGAADTIVPPSATAVLGALSGTERKLIPRFRHEVHNEEGGGEVIIMITDWVEARLAN